MTYLILVRHGESRWNLDNRFTGWVDVPLSQNGIREALACSKNLAEFHIDVCFTSTLTRAQETLLLILADQEYTGVFMHDKGKEKEWAHHKSLGTNEIPVFTSSKLNERYYGKLQGLNKDEARAKYGKEKVFKWRRSYDIKPPGGECLKDTYKRSVPYFKKEILPHLKKKNVLISAHGNSLRAIIKHLENISNEEIPHLELPTGIPIIYEYNKGKLTRNADFEFTRPLKWKLPSKPRFGKNKAFKKR
ncbi:2,3-bisphosphoglycerate-dependent phosphoglycerate mutase [Candidatus Woesearchaeota archaeon]|nr:2,3-bisphosphoglycerate-dependent phosphoglycerate mutase [Candidatus Woesearchaeota archaeon]